ncbi:MAG: hypothetical protein LBS22_01605 [Puniceicoccales bacterium]|nr:hypothetical protein [Puniceicoccales bacterium]
MRSGKFDRKIKDKAAVSSKLAATKINVPATTKTKFAHKQALRSESINRSSAIAEVKVAQYLDKVPYNP